MALKRLLFKKHPGFGAFYLCVFCLLLGADYAKAQSITEVTPLSFGRIALTGNTQSYVMFIDRLGNITKDSAIAILEAGVPAEYVLEGYPPNTILNVSVTTPSIITNLGGVCCLNTSQMTISNFDYPFTITTDAIGSALLNVGARMATETGGVYVDGVYYINLVVTVSY